METLIIAGFFVIFFIGTKCSTETAVNRTYCDTVSQENADLCCENMVDGYLLADVLDCRRLYVCLGSRAEHLFCSRYHLFDKDTLTCMPSSVANCAGQEDAITEIAVDVLDNNVLSCVVDDEQSAADCCAVMTQAEIYFIRSRWNDHYVCINRVSELIDCTEGFVFDISMKVCRPIGVKWDHDDDFKVSNVFSHGFNCSGQDNESFYIIEKPCEKFYLCDGTTINSMSCPKHWYFDVLAASCRPGTCSSDKYDSAAAATTTSNIVIYDNNVVANCNDAEDCCNANLLDNTSYYIPKVDGDCSSFFMCVFGSNVRIDCPVGWHFDVSTAACIPGGLCNRDEQPAVCNTTSSLQQAIECCKTRQHGDLLADVTDCASLYQCNKDAGAVKLFCSKYHHFDKITKNCVPMSQASCDILP